MNSLDCFSATVLCITGDIVEYLLNGFYLNTYYEAIASYTKSFVLPYTGLIETNSSSTALKSNGPNLWLKWTNLPCVFWCHSKPNLFYFFRVVGTWPADRNQSKKSSAQSFCKVFFAASLRNFRRNEVLREFASNSSVWPRNLLKSHFGSCFNGSRGIWSGGKKTMGIDGIEMELGRHFKPRKDIRWEKMVRVPKGLFGLQKMS